MNKHYPAGHRMRSDLIDDEEQELPVWVWMIGLVLIALILLVR